MTERGRRRRPSLALLTFWEVSSYGVFLLIVDI